MSNALDSALRNMRQAAQKKSKYADDDMSLEAQNYRVDLMQAEREKRAKEAQERALKAAAQRQGPGLGDWLNSVLKGKTWDNTTTMGIR